MRSLPYVLLCAGLCLVLASCGGSSSSDATKAKVNTSTAITSSANPSVPGEVATFIARVKPNGSGTPTGSVTFSDGSNTLGSSTLNGSGVATLSASNLSVGSHSISASYQGDNSFLASSSSTVTQVVQNAPAGSISPNFFALDMGHMPPNEPWPTQLAINFAVWRSLGSTLRWSDLATCDGGTDPTSSCYSWSSFDNWINTATSFGQQVLYTAYYTPSSLSSNPGGACQSQGTGGCYPPNDVENGDAHWKNFLIALYTHVQGLPPVQVNGTNNTAQPHIAFWECWNEPDVTTEYNGTLADLHTLCNDMHDAIAPLDPTAKFTSPAPAEDKQVAPWLQAWITGTGYDPTKVDIIAFHGYVQSQIPEDIFNDILAPLSAFIPQTGKPLWDTEGSDLIGLQPLADPDMHAAFYARYALIQQSNSVATFSYWGYDFGNGDNLINNPATPQASPNKAGMAWQQIYDWTVGSVFTSPCHPTGTVWQCALTNSSSVPTLVVWDTSQSCSNGNCTTSSFTAPSGFTTYIDLAGNSTTISGGVVPIGAKPVLLQ